MKQKETSIELSQHDLELGEMRCFGPCVFNESRLFLTKDNGDFIGLV